MVSIIRGVYQTIRKWPGDRSFEFSDTTRRHEGVVPIFGHYAGEAMSQTVGRLLRCSAIEFSDTTGFVTSRSYFRTLRDPNIPL